MAAKHLRIPRTRAKAPSSSTNRCWNSWDSTDQLGEGGEGRLAALIEPAFGGDDLTLKGGRDAFDPAMIGRRPIEHDLGLGDR